MILLKFCWKPIYMCVIFVGTRIPTYSFIFPFLLFKWAFCKIRYKAYEPRSLDGTMSDFGLCGECDSRGLHRQCYFFFLRPPLSLSLPSIPHISPAPIHQHEIESDMAIDRIERVRRRRALTKRCLRVDVDLLGDSGGLHLDADGLHWRAPRQPRRSQIARLLSGLLSTTYGRAWFLFQPN